MTSTDYCCGGQGHWGRDKIASWENFTTEDDMEEKGRRRVPYLIPLTNVLLPKTSLPFKVSVVPSASSGIPLLPASGKMISDSGDLYSLRSTLYLCMTPTKPHSSTFPAHSLSLHRAHFSFSISKGNELISHWDKRSFPSFTLALLRPPYLCISFMYKKKQEPILETGMRQDKIMQQNINESEPSLIFFLP